MEGGWEHAETSVEKLGQIKMEEGEDRHGEVASASRKLPVDSSGSFAEAATGRK